MNIYELNAKTGNVICNGKNEKSIDVFAFASGQDNRTITIAYELIGEEQQMFVYDGAINTSDPGEGPMDEYSSREEAAASEYGNLFGTVFTLADSMK